MKNGILQFAITLTLLTFLVAAFPTEEDYAVYDETLRLHILANSDSREDQDLKIGVRDLVLDRFGGRLSEADAIDSAMMITDSMLDEIRGEVDEYLADAGCSFGSEVTLGREWYETRDYGEFTLPRGYYSSLIIKLGKGEGQNWWCIMFPPLCRELASGNGADDGGKVCEIAGEKYSVKFKTLEIIADLFKKKG